MSRLTPFGTQDATRETSSLSVAHGSGGQRQTLNYSYPLHIPQNANQPTIAPRVLPKWRPRTGRNDDYINWHDALISIEADLDIMADCTEPTLQELEAKRTPENAHWIEDAYQEAIAWYRRDDTILFDMIKKSLMFDGAHFEADLRKVNSFIVNNIKRGRELRAWALSHADSSSLEDQTSLRTKLTTIKIRNPVTVTSLEVECQALYNTWGLIAGNDLTELSSLMTYYHQLLAAFPAPSNAPSSVTVASVKKWLADKIVDESPDLVNPDNLITKMCKYANTIGMEKGKSDADGDSVLAAITATFKKNMCDFCDANLCLSRVKGGVSKCISKWNSTFDIDTCKASDGQKDYVKGLRMHHKENPNITTLKGVKFELKPKPSGGQMTALIDGTDDPDLVKLLGPDLAGEITDSEEFKALLSECNISFGDGMDPPPYDDGVLMVLGEWDAPSPSVMPDTPKPKDSPLSRWHSIQHTEDGGASDKTLRGKTPNIDKPVAPQLKGGGGAISIPLPLNISSISTQIIPLAKEQFKNLAEILASRGKHELIALIASLVTLPRLAPKSTAKTIGLLQCILAWSSKHTQKIFKRVKTLLSALVALTIKHTHA